MYDAIDVAKYAIDYYHEKGLTITNLKLQKLLYYIQGECLKVFDFPVFADAIRAWKHGPVVPTVYRQYNKYAGTPILEHGNPSCKFSPNYIKVFNKILDKYKDADAWELVTKTHQEDPWKDAYVQGEMDNQIPISEIKKYFTDRKVTARVK